MRSKKLAQFQPQHETINSKHNEVKRVIALTIFTVHVLTTDINNTKGVNKRLKYVTQIQQQRPESPTVALVWHAYITSTRYILKPT